MAKITPALLVFDLFLTCSAIFINYTPAIRRIAVHLDETVL